MKYKIFIYSKQFLGQVSFLKIKILKIFGAFCSGLWSERKQKVNYFGNGETFLFKIMPEKKIFRWVGTRAKTTPSQEMFLRTDGKKIVIGGG